MPPTKVVLGVRCIVAQASVEVKDLGDLSLNLEPYSKHKNVH